MLVDLFEKSRKNEAVLVKLTKRAKVTWRVKVQHTLPGSVYSTLWLTHTLHKTKRTGSKQWLMGMDFGLGLGLGIGSRLGLVLFLSCTAVAPSHSSSFE